MIVVEVENVTSRLGVDIENHPLYVIAGSEVQVIEVIADVDLSKFAEALVVQAIETINNFAVNIPTDSITEAQLTPEVREKLNTVAGGDTPLGGIVDLKNAFAWDSFNRPDGPIGVADSGQAWGALPGSLPFQISNKSISGTGLMSDFQTAVIDRGIASEVLPLQGGGRITCDLLYRQNSVRLIIAKDINNYFHLGLTFGGNFLIKTIGGVQTVLLNQTGINRSAGQSTSVDFRLDRNLSGNLFLSAFDFNSGITIRADISGEYATFDLSEWRYIGFAFRTIDSPTAAYIKNVTMYNL